MTIRVSTALLLLVGSAMASAQVPAHTRAAELAQWPIHDLTRPMPPVVNPGPAEPPAPVPADAILLFDGKTMDGWVNAKDQPAAWVVQDGVMQAVKGAGSIKTVKTFGDCQLHIEWSSPNPPVGQSQDRGNSGVFLMNTYEIQVLDSYQATTYADGMAGAMYGQFPPAVNATRAPGEWQAYDIVFRAPRFAADGTVRARARVTVFLNGVLLHDAEEFTGPTGHKARPPYKAHADRLPIGLQDHAHPVRFRNIWIRDLAK